jgi:lipopolysaccharide transport system ATP-binding protein
MSTPAIRAAGLGKRYRLGEHHSFGSLRESLVNGVRSVTRRRSRSERASIWALRDVSFEIAPGEAVGIIGRNGAGKSTLLKVLSRITEPTTGRAEIRGRVGSLLEVGTGFHPELTGRENISLNGAILGMRRAEIAAKFDEIVAFAEVERFIDTPVKRYSSGMYLRLAFAVAAHLEPEILLVDEVLAVGDSAFQKKCLGKMGDVTRQGRTVLFVSHNLAAVANLCSRAVMLDQGRIVAEGPSGQVVDRYVADGTAALGEVMWDDPASAPGNDRVRLRAVRVISRGSTTSDVDIDEPLMVEIEYLNLRPQQRLSVSIHLLDKVGHGVLASANMDSANLGRDPWFDRPHPVGAFRSGCTIPGNFLNEGRYSINAVVLSNVTTIEVLERNVIAFDVHDSGSMRREYTGEWLGVVRPKLEWRTTQLEDSPGKGQVREP